MATYPGKDIEREANAPCAACEQATLTPAEAAAAAWAGPAARIIAVEPESPADDAGFAPGCYLTTVDGEPLRDIIDWRWLCGRRRRLGGLHRPGRRGGRGGARARARVRRGASPSTASVFDGVKPCRNACTFCFMRQLPDGMRPSLTLRDDDFRLSFLSGTFVTLTNLKPDDDERRILEQRISPLRVSLHASRARRAPPHHRQARRSTASRPSTASWPPASRRTPRSSSCPARTTAPCSRHPRVGVGAPRHPQRGHRASGLHASTRRPSTAASTTPGSARAVLDAIAPFQDRARAERGTPWVFAADEFYRNAYRRRRAGKPSPRLRLRRLRACSRTASASSARAWTIGAPRRAQAWPTGAPRALARRTARACYVAGCAIASPSWTLIAEQPACGPARAPLRREPLLRRQRGRDGPPVRRRRRRRHPPPARRTTASRAAVPPPAGHVQRRWRDAR